MAFLDAFFALAVPFTIFCVIFAFVVQKYHAKRGIYRGPDGAARRDLVNTKYRTNAGAVVIGVIFLGLWGLAVGALVEIDLVAKRP